MSVTATNADFERNTIDYFRALIFLASCNASATNIFPSMISGRAAAFFSAAFLTDSSAEKINSTGSSCQP